MKSNQAMGFIFCFGLLMCSCHAAEPPDDEIAEVLVIQGLLHVKVNDTTTFTIHELSDLPNQAIKVGWTIGTDENSLCTLKLRDRSIIRVGPSSSLSFHRKDQRILTWLVRGILAYFRRGKPGELGSVGLKVPAVTDGTEFVFQVDPDGKTTLTLYDGRVVMDSGLELRSGDVIVAEPGKPPVKTAVVNWHDLDAIQWCLYYPAILNLEELKLDRGTRQVIGASIEAYRSGDVLAALAAYPGNRRPDSAHERVYYATLLLSVGKVVEAESLLKGQDGSVTSSRETGTRQAEGSDRQESPTRLAQALLQLIAAVKMQIDTRLIPLATNNLLATEWLALSYLQQAQGHLEQAQKSAQQAVLRSTNFGFAQARFGELEFSLGNVRLARQANDRAIELTPRNAQAHSLQGFLLCAQDKLREARKAFEKALHIDSALGNAWLGRGLCRIRQGDVAGGRLDLETAAALEPQRALLRSYLGKAFFEEQQWNLATDELRLAQAIDPHDPTAWLYSALLKQNLNRINEAITDLEKSKRIYENRYLYRSRLLLDQDSAVRKANLAALYRDAGMAEVAVCEASRAVDSDYALASAHLFLANANDALRDPHLVNLRYETPWYSELLLANLLAPPGIGVLSQNISQQEYSRLFDRHRLGLISTSEYSSGGDWLQTASQYGYYGRLSYSLDVQYRDEIGQRFNEDRTMTSSGAQIKIQLTPQDSFILMAGMLDYEAGDLHQYYEPNQAHRHLRVEEFQEPNLVLGYHHEWLPGSHTLLLFGRLYDTLQLSDPESAALLLTSNDYGVVDDIVPYPNQGERKPFDLDYERKLEIYSAELQHIWQMGDHTIIAGGRFQASLIEVESVMQIAHSPRFDPAPLFQTIDECYERSSLYLYDQWQIKSLRLYAGLAYDYLKYPINMDVAPITFGTQSEDQYSPKSGLLWTIQTNTHVRAAWTRSLGGAYHEQSLRLEPTRIAGFNQAYRSLIPESSPSTASGLIAGAHFENWGFGLDHLFPTRTYFTLQAELLKEDADRSLGAFRRINRWGDPFPSVLNQKLDYQESSLAATLHQLVGRDWSFGVSYRVSQAELSTRYPGIPFATQLSARDDYALLLDENSDALLHELRLSVRYYHPSGLFGCLETHWHAQENDGDMAYFPGDNFWQTDAWLGYRFWHRQVVAQVGLLNIFDQNYQLNPLNLYYEMPRERTLVFQLRFVF